ncbi:MULTISPECIES: hypothetical protein [Adhaeribacter]|uniref:Uncharacterized protein n=2 Tax=Adhaeribacter TaxID=299566 RepID=A0A512AT14_9BACT|nr:MULTISPECIES: hypothetical protein [Adhaeribacter]KAA5545737.1 hypothetical protein F0145_12455 [Adhaeribacter rhizoryzae]GEO02820.1 hypothetical protein AAE02nite_04840 [Adhaeribacter aerolatus]
MDQANNTSLVQPQDLSRAFENVMHVFKDGNYEKLPDLLQDTGHLLMKASKKLTPRQMVLAVAAVAVVTIFVVARAADDNDEHHQAA